MLKNETSILTVQNNNGVVEKNENHWNCNVFLTSPFQSAKACHFFKLKNENLDCPNAFDDLELLSFLEIKNVSNLPSYFLLAIKFNEGTDFVNKQIKFLDLYKSKGTEANDKVFGLNVSDSDKDTKYKTCTKSS